MTYIPDPIELLESRMDALMEHYIDDKTCMQCKKVVDYELYCMSPIGDGPLLCAGCAGQTINKGE